MLTIVLVRLPWGEESLLREDTDDNLWFFGPAGENNYRVAGVSLIDMFPELNQLFLDLEFESGEVPTQWQDGAGGGVRPGGVLLCFHLLTTQDCFQVQPPVNLSYCDSNLCVLDR